LARSLEIIEDTPVNQRRFNNAYMAMYPCLTSYVTGEDLTGKKVLVIGRGYGTLGPRVVANAMARMPSNPFVCFCMAYQDVVMVKQPSRWLIDYV